MDYFGSKTVARDVGVSLWQIQYWDEQGFIHPSIRPASEGEQSGFIPFLTWLS